MGEMNKSLQDAIDRLSDLRDKSAPPSWPAVRRTIDEAVQDLGELREDLTRLAARLESLDKRYRELKSEVPPPGNRGRPYRG